MCYFPYYSLWIRLWLLLEKTRMRVEGFELLWRAGCMLMRLVPLLKPFKGKLNSEAGRRLTTFVLPLQDCTRHSSGRRVRDNNDILFRGHASHRRVYSHFCNPKQKQTHKFTKSYFLSLSLSPFFSQTVSQKHTQTHIIISTLSLVWVNLITKPAFTAKGDPL